MDLKRKNEAEIDHTSNKLNKSTYASLNSSLTRADTKDYLLESWNERNPSQFKGQHKDVEVTLQPYKLCIARNFLSNPTFLKDLKCELLDVELISKCNDLYQYHQSADLATIDSPAINALKELMQDHTHDWLQEVTGCKLNQKLAINCSTYNYTDNLLCHDDQIEDRLIAFVLYLNSDKWTEADGGQLRMFNIDENNQPKDVVKSILPEHNSFVFFEVTSKSFHEVAEILTADRTRLSVNGWFHGIPNAPSQIFVEPSLPYYVPQSKPELDCYSFINEAYLDIGAQGDMSTHFEEASEILLTDFLLPSQYSSLACALQSEDICWVHRGPANRRNYFVAKEETLPSCVRDLVDFFKSHEMFTILQNYTSLELAESESAGTSTSSSEGPRCSVEVQRWAAGCYTVVHDNDCTQKEQALDLTLYFNAEKVEPYHGGFIKYLARDDDEELLMVNPKSNALALTFKDNDTLRFVKYVNHRLREEDLFHTISLTYYE